MPFYQLFHLILHEIDRFGCFMLKSGFFSKSLVLCLKEFPSYLCINGKEMYKKCDARAKLLFCLLKLVFSFDVVVAVASLDLKVPID